MWEEFVGLVRGRYEGRVEEGAFGEMMSVEMVNDGPVTIIVDSREERREAERRREEKRKKKEEEGQA